MVLDLLYNNDTAFHQILF